MSDIFKYAKKNKKWKNPLMCDCVIVKFDGAWYDIYWLSDDSKSTERFGIIVNDGKMIKGFDATKYKYSDFKLEQLKEILGGIKK